MGLNTASKSRLGVIGPLFLNFFDNSMETYMLYVTNFSRAHSLLRKEIESNPALQKWIQTTENSIRGRCRQKEVSLESLLIEPVQRTFRYQLMLDSLIEKTEVSHPDFANLHKAVAKVETINKSTNFSKKELDNHDQLVRINNLLQEKLDLSNKRYLEETNIILNSKIYRLIIFEDMLLVCKDARYRLKLKHKIDLVTAKVTPIQNPEKNEYGLRIDLQKQKALYLFFADLTESEKYNQLIKTSQATVKPKNLNHSSFLLQWTSK